MSRLTRFLAFIIIAAVGAAYLIFSHLLTVADNPSLAMLALGVAPLAVMALLAAWNSRWRWPTLALLLFAALALVWNLNVLRNHISWLYFVQHAGAMALLALTFGSTLGHGDAQALCSRIARLIQPDLVDPVYMRYTWKVTLAWTLYFALSGLLSVALFFFGPLVVWSYFANLLTPIFVGLMFVVEYLVRLRVLPERTPFSIRQIVETYRSYARR